MLPVVAIVGRPNVGKSTLFNALTKSRDALVADLPGVTRDRHYGVCRLGARPFVLVDTGGLPHARAILEELRRAGKPVVLAVNKTDGLDAEGALAEFAALGVAQPVPLAAAHGRGSESLLAQVLPLLPRDDEPAPDVENASGTRVAIVGRPNVGKSTLVNRLLGEERVVVSEIAGTTRDAIHVPLERDGRRYTLIDTAGVRRRARVE